MSFSYSNGVITQTGTDTDLSGLTGLTVVNVTSYSNRYEIYDIGTNRLDIEGNLTINPEENMFISNASTSTIPNMVLNVRNGAILTLGVKTTVGTAIKYTTGKAFILAETGNLNSNGSFHVESGATLRAYGATILLAGPSRMRAGSILDIEDLTVVNCRGSACQFRIEHNNVSDVALVSISKNGLTLNGQGSNDSCRLTTTGATNTFNSNSFIFNFIRAQYQPGGAGYPSQVFLNFDNGNNIDSIDFSYAGTTSTDKIQYDGNLVDFRNVARRIRYGNANNKGGFSKTTKNLEFNLQDASSEGINTISYYAKDVNNENRINFNGFNSLSDIVYSGQNAGSTLALNITVEFMAGQSTTQLVDSRTNADNTILFRFISYTTNITESSPVLIGLLDLNSVIVNADDSLVTELNRSTVDTYTDLGTSQKIYDAYKSNLVSNYTGQSTTIVGRVGNQIDLDQTATSLIIDATAVSVKDLTGTTATVKALTYTGGAVTTASGTVTTKNGALLNGGNFDCNVNYQSGANTTLTNVTVNGILDFNTVGTYTLDGCTISEVTNSSGGNITLTLINGATVTTNNDPNITILDLRNISITGLSAGYTLRIYNTTTLSELFNQVVTGTEYTTTYSEGTGYSQGDQLEIRVSKIDKLEFKRTVVVGANGWSQLVEQEDNLTYNAHGVDGSTVQGISWDGGNMQFDFDDADNEIEGADIAAWYFYFITTSIGIREAFEAILWPQINIVTNRASVRPITFHNVKNTPLVIKNCWISRDDGISIISNIPNNSIQIDPPAVFQIGLGGLENKVQNLVDAENADIFVTPTRFTKKKEGTETVILEKTYTTDGQGTESLTEVT